MALIGRKKTKALMAFGLMAMDLRVLIGPNAESGRLCNERATVSLESD